MSFINIFFFNYILPTISQSILTLLIVMLILAIFRGIHPRYKTALYSLIIFKALSRFLLGSPHIIKTLESYPQSQSKGLFIYIPDPTKMIPFRDFAYEVKFFDISYFQNETFLLFLIICVGILIFLIYRWIGIHFFYKQLLREKEINPSKEKGLYRFVEQLCKKMKIKKVKLLESKKISSPFTVGIINPTIIIPRAVLDDLTEIELQQIVTHEIMHVKRRDSIKKWFLTIIGDLLFFAPPIYFARKKINEYIEQDCDFRTIQLSKNPKDLAQGILKIASIIKEYELSQPKPMIISNHFLYRSSDLKQRIISFSKVKDLKTRRWKTVLFFIFYIVSLIYQLSWAITLSGRQLVF